MNSQNNNGSSRVAVVGGARTPFVKAGGVFSELSFLDLGVEVVDGFLDKAEIEVDRLDELVFSTVLLDPRTPNAARELVFKSRLLNSLPAHFISNNCISGLVAVNYLAEGIKVGRIRSGLAGGSESMSRPTLTFRRKAEDLFLGLSRARTFGQRLGYLSKYRPSFMFPVPPSPKEPSTGLTMGQHCEITAKEFGVTREAQDSIALNSHLNAVRARDAGYFDSEIISIGGVSTDNLVREGSSMEALSKLRPVFDRSDLGTLTAGNSSALTDGASIVCLMSEEEANARGREPLAYVRAVNFSAIDPSDGLLMAPGVCVPELLKKEGLTVDDIDLFEVHEAFGAQVVANLQVWESGWEKFPEMKPIGNIPEEKLNVNGGSIALGHPFAATGGRLILSLANQLKRTGGKRGVISVCAAGAMACAMIIERD